MTQNPIIAFRAGICDVDTSVTPIRVTPKPDRGIIYLYNGDDELIHFCWRKRSTNPLQPELDLVMIPGDAAFLDYDPERPSGQTNGRIYFIKFNSSSQHHFFWLQSGPDNLNNHSRRGERDRKIADIVYSLLQGEEVDVNQELEELEHGDEDDDEEYEEEDEAMEDADGNTHGATGGAGAGATGGDVRDEGEDAREGGADGARAASGNANTQETLQNLLSALEGSIQPGLQGASSSTADSPFPSLTNLLTSSTTIPLIAETALEEDLDRLISFLPPVIVLSAAPISESLPCNPLADVIEAVRASLSAADKRDILNKVLRSPQFSQSLGSLTMAIRDGGLPTIADALNIDVENGGYMRGGGMPEGGNRAVRAFVEGIRRTVKKEGEKK